MSDRTKPVTKPGIDVNGITEVGTKSATAMTQLHARMFRDALKFNAELLDFARRRLGEDIKATEQLCRCESMPDAMSVMNDFYQKAVQQYTDETSNLVQFSRTTAAEATREIRGETGQAGKSKPDAS